MQRELLAEELSAHFLSGYPYIYLTTWEEERAGEIIATAAQKAGRAVLTFSVTQVKTSSGASTSPEEILFQQLQKYTALKEPSVVVLHDIHPYFESKLVVRLLRDLVKPLSSKGISFVFLSPVFILPPELEKEVAIVDMPLPGLHELEKVFRKVQLENNALFPEEFVERVVQAALGLTAHEAERVFRRALLKGGGFKLDDIHFVIEEKKRLLKQSELLEFFEAGEGLTGVGGLSELKKWLQDRERAFSEDAGKFGLSAPKGMMLIGVQGCGKSLTAKAVARLWHFPLLRFDVGSAFNVWGKGEENLRRAIKVSESLSPVVLWVDEIEKGFAGAGTTAADRDIARAFGTFITWLQEKNKPVFVVATANDITGLPPELMRKGRFDEIFFIDLPDIHEREEIFAIHVSKRKRVPSKYDIKSLAEESDHYSGSEIEQVVVSALYRAFSENRDMTQRDLEIALKETVPLYSTYEERIKGLRDWAKHRARFASHDVSLLDYFGESVTSAKKLTK